MEDKNEMYFKIDGSLAAFIEGLAKHYGMKPEEVIKAMITARLTHRIAMQKVYPDNPERWGFRELMLIDEQGTHLKGDELSKALVTLIEIELKEIKVLQETADTILNLRLSGVGGGNA